MVTRAILILCMGGAPLTARSAVPVRVVDRGQTAQSDSDVAFGPQGEVLVAYTQIQEQAMKLARVDCGTMSYTALNDQVPDGRWPSILMDTWGSASVVYENKGDGLPGMLRYTLDEAGPWGLATAGIPNSEGASVPVAAMDSADRPYVAFRTINGPVALAYFEIPSGTWQIEIVPGPQVTGAPGRVIAIATDHQDRVVVAYCDATGRITTATRSGGWWSVRSTPDTVPLVVSSGLAVVCDSADAPVVACALASELRVYRFNVLNVTSQVVATQTRAVLGPHAMAIDRGNHLRIAFYDEDRATLTVASNEFGWSTAQVDTVSSVTTPSLALDSQGRWAVAYADPDLGLLKVAGITRGFSVAPDFDCDRDVDPDDVEILRQCATGPALPYSPDIPDGCAQTVDGEGILPADLDRDMDVDQADFAVLQRCYSGPGIFADTSCAD